MKCMKSRCLKKRHKLSRFYTMMTDYELKMSQSNNFESVGKYKQKMTELINQFYIQSRDSISIGFNGWDALFFTKSASINLRLLILIICIIDLFYSNLFM
jgi:hypothetical protein